MLGLALGEASFCGAPAGAGSLFCEKVDGELDRLIELKLGALRDRGIKPLATKLTEKDRCCVIARPPAFQLFESDPLRDRLDRARQSSSG
jgi:hypothetical protein